MVPDHGEFGPGTLRKMGEWLSRAIEIAINLTYSQYLDVKVIN